MPESAINEALMEAIKARYQAQVDLEEASKKKEAQIKASVTQTIEKLNGVSEQVSASQKKTREYFSHTLAKINFTADDIQRELAKFIVEHPEEFPGEPAPEEKPEEHNEESEVKENA